MGRHVVIATGVRARSLPGIPPDAALPGILLGPGEAVVAQSFKGKTVAVLGGGDNAFENALYALDHGARHVEIFARTTRAQAQFMQRFPAQHVHVGTCHVNATARQVNGQTFDLIMVFYGWEPCALFADDLGLQRTNKGFLATDPKTAQTSCPGVYAVGEVAQRQHPCVVTAMADGVAAAKAIQARLEAAAH
jgi:thioredoxin reductase